MRGLALAIAAVAASAIGPGAHDRLGARSLVSDRMDPKLVNPWGLAASATFTTTPRCFGIIAFNPTSRVT